MDLSRMESSEPPIRYGERDKARPLHDRKCGRWEPDHQPHEWSTPHSRRDGIYYWCEGPTVVEGGRRGAAR